MLQTYADRQDVNTVKNPPRPPSQELQMASSHAKGSLPLLRTSFLHGEDGEADSFLSGTMRP